MVFAVLSRVLLGIVLLSDIQSVANEKVDINTLARIQRFFHFNYENGLQYAVAINVPKKQCRSRFFPSPANFLKNDPSEDVKPYIKRDSMEVYQGTELIAAGVHRNAHSEHLLMNPPFNSPLTHLLNKRNDGCVVFYTLISPCVDKCLNSNVVLSGLCELENYQGMKAFVYTYIYNKDQNKQNLRNELQKIANRVPLYRCGRNGCIYCENTVIDACLNGEF
ncbi:uncharacterized protein LOC130241959 [Danio aesculapii]|uniref:uncharacterized protein LOC130241959 n=1 Tax=Danio aesculapii TaxID=1142201 RepID=UPI0024BFCA6E|nr:uncharacterized protein LOC130241959 [Danio aesculapii]